MAEWQIRKSDLKRYPHFDQIINPADIVALVTDPVRVAQNSFYPLLRYSKGWQPFRQVEGGATAKPKPKDRPIRYAARRDAYIFAYYRQILSDLYELELERLHIGHCPVAYRRIPAGDGDPKGKCNINFAKEAFDRIRDLGDCCAIAVDISSYFESIDHGRLKTLWCRLLGVDRLPPDHFAVFKNITAYRVVERIDAYARLGFYGVKAHTTGGTPINGYLTPFRDVPIQLCSPTEFRQKILGENGLYPSLVQPNRLPHGIPQGAPISDLLANLYLIDFDVEMNDLATSLGGSYVRYSDDILLVLPISVDEATAIMESLPDRIRAHGPEMLIKPAKSSLIRYTRNGDVQDCERIVGKGVNGLEYLGFRFNGRGVYLRDSTMANLYRKVSSLARSQAQATVRRYPGKSLEQLKTLFNYEEFDKRFGRVEKFEAAAGRRRWTFWTYVARARREFGPAGNRIQAQVGRLKQRSRHKIGGAIERALDRRDRRTTADLHADDMIDQPIIISSGQSD